MLKSGMTAIRSDIQPELIEFLSVLDIYEPCPDPEIPVSGRPKLARLVPKYSRMSRLRCPLRSQFVQRMVSKPLVVSRARLVSWVGRPGL